MINYNGEIYSENIFKLSYQNRGFKYGDAIFDTLKYRKNKIHFIEDHYFRLMSSLRMLRMKIPMNFTLNFFEKEILKVVNTKDLNKTTRIRVTIFRKEGGLYLPDHNEINFLIESNELILQEQQGYEIELYKDFQINSGILSSIKTNNRIINVTASIFASENGYQNCILLNEKKNIVEAVNSNIFLISGNEIFTPLLDEGCINGIIRKKIIEVINSSEMFEIKESEISPYELLKADEVFITNSITEIQSVKKYRKKEYTTTKTEIIYNLLEKII